MHSSRRLFPNALSFLLILSAPAWLAAEGMATRVACIGDSITAGSGLSRDDLTYPQHLAEKLGPDCRVENFGSSGRTFLTHGNAPYIKTREWAAAQAFQPDIAIVILGSNDSKPKNIDRINDLSTDAATLIRTLKALPSKPRIYLGLPPPVYREIFGINEPNLAKLRVLLKAVAERENIPVIDLSSALGERPDLFPDGVHPNAAGVELLARVVFAAISTSATNPKP